MQKSCEILLCIFYNFLRNQKVFDSIMVNGMSIENFEYEFVRRKLYCLLFVIQLVALLRTGKLVDGSVWEQQQKWCESLPLE